MIWALIALLALGLVTTWVWIALRRSDPALPLIQQQMATLTDSLTRAVNQTQTSVGDRLQRTTELFSQVQERLGRMEEAHRQVQTLGQEMMKLQDILRVPKLRGNLSELFLEELLSQILPASHYQMQYAFRSGEKVDAIIRLPQEHLVPIDAKFPLENFQRLVATETSDADRRIFRKSFEADFKKHVDQIASKYILPDEGTLDFAFLYIPAENVYYETIIADERLEEPLGLNSYALRKRVIPVSPSNLYAYLQLILLGLRGLRVEKQALDIISFLSRLQGDLGKLQEDLELVGRHLNNATTAHQRTEKRLGGVQQRIERIEEQKPDPKLTVVDTSG